MIQASYDQILERISRLSSVTKEELERRIEAKRAKLSGLVSKEGAAQIIAAELGVSFENQRMKISELLMGLRRANVLGKILKIEPVRSYKKNEREGKIGVLRIADDSGSIRVVLWDTNHIALLEKQELGEGDVVEINAASVRGTAEKELHLSNASSILKSNIKIEVPEAVSDSLNKMNEGTEKTISEMKLNERIKTRANLVQLFEPRFFATCPECKTKILQQGEHFYCSSHGNVIPQYRAIMTVVLDDGTENIRAVLFDEAIVKLLAIEKEEIEKLREPDFSAQRKEASLGKEFLISGRVRLNKFFNSPELIVNDLEEANPDELIKQLEQPQKAV